MSTPSSSQPNGPSRRNFLRTGAFASAALAAGVHAHGQEDGQKKDKLNIALVGCGGRGGGASRDSLQINPNVTLMAVADLKLANCEAVVARNKDRFGDKVKVDPERMHSGLDAYKKVLEDPAVDVVMFATPPGFRPRHILEAVQAGKHVFAEKPSCVDPAGYRINLQAHAEAEKNGTAIVTGTQYRRQVNYIGAVDEIRKGTIGDIISATTRYCANGIWNRPRKPGQSDVEYQLQNWMHYVWLSGDQIAEQAVHNIDAMNWVFGSPPVAAYGSGGRFTRPADSEMWDNVSVDYEYPGNRVLSFMCRQIPKTRGDNGNVIYGTKGICYIGASNAGSKITDRKGKDIWSMKGKIADAYRQEHKDLVDSIMDNKPIVELKQTAASSLTAVMGRMAAYTGQKVTWDFVTTQSKLDLFPPNLKLDMELKSPGYAKPGTTKLI